MTTLTYFLSCSGSEGAAVAIVEARLTRPAMRLEEPALSPERYPVGQSDISYVVTVTIAPALSPGIRDTAAASADDDTELARRYRGLLDAESRFRDAQDTLREARDLFVAESAREQERRRR